MKTLAREAMDDKWLTRAVVSGSEPGPGPGAVSLHELEAPPGAKEAKHGTWRMAPPRRERPTVPHRIRVSLMPLWIFLAIGHSYCIREIAQMVFRPWKCNVIESDILFPTGILLIFRVFYGSYARGNTSLEICTPDIRISRISAGSEV